MKNQIKDDIDPMAEEMRLLVKSFFTNIYLIRNKKQEDKMIFVQKTGLIQLKLRKEIKKGKSLSNLKNKN